MAGSARVFAAPGTAYSMAPWPRSTGLAQVSPWSLEQTTWMGTIRSERRSAAFASTSGLLSIAVRFLCPATASSAGQSP